MTMESIFSNPKVWIALAFILLVGSLYKTIARILAKTLDERSQKIASELAEAQKLRVEAQEVLQLYRQKQAEYTKEAEQILRKAREDADRMVASAETDLKALMDERVEQSVQKIALEEERAIAEVRENIVDVSLSAAKVIIEGHVATASPDELLKLSLEDIERNVH